MTKPVPAGQIRSDLRLWMYHGCINPLCIASSEPCSYVRLRSAKDLVSALSGTRQHEPIRRNSALQSEGRQFDSDTRLRVGSSVRICRMAINFPRPGPASRRILRAGAADGGRADPHTLVDARTHSTTMMPAAAPIEAAAARRYVSATVADGRDQGRPIREQPWAAVDDRVSASSRFGGWRAEALSAAEQAMGIAAAQPDQRSTRDGMARHGGFGYTIFLRSYIQRIVMKTLIDLVEIQLAAAQAALRTTTKKDTVNTALAEAVALAARRRDLLRLQAGGLPELADEVTMASAWQR